MQTVSSVWTWFAMAVLIVVWLPLLAIIRLLDRDPAHYTTGRWFRRLGAMMTRVNPAWKIHIDGDFPADPRKPFVVVCNHQSLADIPVISRLPWEMKWVAKAELFRVPFVGWLMRMAGDIPVVRGDRRSGIQVLATARQYLQKRCSVMFFPEGTRSKDSRVLSFTDGAFRLAIKQQVPVLPLVLDGTSTALRKHDWRFGRAQKIHLKVLPAVPTEGLSGSDVEALRDRVRNMIVDQLAGWRGVPRAEIDTPIDGRELIQGGSVQ